MTPPEFSRPVRVDTLGSEPRTMAIEAEAEERAALARRFGLIELGRLSAELALTRRGVEVAAKGRLSAEAAQSCVATAEPVPESLDAPFDIVFRPVPDAGQPDEEVELSENDLDVVFYDGATIDLGEAMAETLALSLEPYPRAPAADAALKEAGVKSEEEARVESSPFAALSGLKDKLGK
jgi:uncharacterized metal-binding protein YceD (DUF177 family)